MQFYGALVLFVTLGAALGLRCYTCVGEICAETITCPAMADRCATFMSNGVVFKSCMMQVACIDPIQCCDKDLCNSALPTGPSGQGTAHWDQWAGGLLPPAVTTPNSALPTGPSSVVLLLLVTSAIITLFL